MQKKWLSKSAILILILALIFSYYAQHLKQKEIRNYYGELIPCTCTFQSIACNAVKVLDQNGNIVGYAGIDQYHGFGGPLLVGIVTDPDGILTELKVLEHKETPQYLKKIAEEGYFEQYQNRDIKQGLIFGKNIDGITQATLSTRAIAMSAESISESIRVNGLGLPPCTTYLPWQIGFPEIITAVLILLCLVIANIPDFRKFRPILLLISVITMGFWLNRPATMAQISGLFLGYFPCIKTGLMWYLVLMIALLPPLIKGKNYYCTYICPFGAVQEGIHGITKKVSSPLGTKIPFLHKTRTSLVFVALLLAFLFQNPSIASFEPFAALFSFQSTGIQLLLLSAVLISAIFFRRIWCLGFCPVGGFLDIVAGFRRSIGRSNKPHKKEALTSNPDKAQEKPVHCTTKSMAKSAETLFILLYATIFLGVVIAIFEKWALM